MTHPTFRIAAALTMTLTLGGFSLAWADDPDPFVGTFRMNAEPPGDRKAELIIQRAKSGSPGYRLTRTAEGRTLEGRGHVEQSQLAVTFSPRRGACDRVDALFEPAEARQPIPASYRIDPKGQLRGVFAGTSEVEVRLPAKAPDSKANQGLLPSPLPTREGRGLTLLRNESHGLTLLRNDGPTSYRKSLGKVPLPNQQRLHKHSWSDYRFEVRKAKGEVFVVFKHPRLSAFLDDAVKAAQDAVSYSILLAVVTENPAVGLKAFLPIWKLAMTKRVGGRVVKEFSVNLDWKKRTTSWSNH
jgi:hypothetical protein